MLRRKGVLLRGRPNSKSPVVAVRIAPSTLSETLVVRGATQHDEL